MGGRDPYANVSDSEQEDKVDKLFESTDVRDRLPAPPPPPAPPPAAAGVQTPYANAYAKTGYANAPGAPAKPAGGAPPRLPVVPGGGFTLIKMTEGGVDHDRRRGIQEKKGDGGVVYMSEERRNKHQAVMGHKILRQGMALDSAQLRKLFQGKVDRGETSNKPGHANLFGADPEIKNAWKNTALIWVCVDDDGEVKFFSGVAKQDHIHHSSYEMGGDLIGAGEWIVEDGVLKRISANSGHYRPNLDSLIQSVHLMSQAHRKETTVLMWQVKPLPGKWVERLVSEFIASPSGNGLYKVHPDAAG